MWQRDTACIVVVCTSVWKKSERKDVADKMSVFELTKDTH